MSLPHVLPAVGLAAAALLLLSPQARVPALVAALAAGVELLLATGVIKVQAGGVPVTLILGAALLAAAVVAWRRVTSKLAVGAATVAVLAGAVQVLRSLGRL
jgi:glucose dehydrogenase